MCGPELGLNFLGVCWDTVYCNYLTATWHWEMLTGLQKIRYPNTTCLQMSIYAEDIQNYNQIYRTQRSCRGTSMEEECKPQFLWSPRSSLGQPRDGKRSGCITHLCHTLRE